jgi:hypothetical protein
VSNRKEKLILDYLERTYGKSELFENDITYSIAGVCIYYKISKQIGFTGVVHLDLVNWFGDGRHYYPELRKWFSEKYNLEVI